MPSNKIILECISLLASAIHHVNMNARSRHIAAQVEGMVHGAQVEDAAHEIKQWREIASLLKEIGDLFANTAAATGDASKSRTGTLLSKSILEDEMKRLALIEVTSSSPNSVASDPFAPTFEVMPSAGGYTATIAMREGSVVYLVNATGPRSNAVKVSAAGLLPVLVEPLVEIPQ